MQSIILFRPIHIYERARARHARVQVICMHMSFYALVRILLFVHAPLLARFYGRTLRKTRACL